MAVTGLAQRRVLLGLSSGAKNVRVGVCAQAEA